MGIQLARTRVEYWAVVKFELVKILTVEKTGNSLIRPLLKIDSHKIHMSCIALDNMGYNQDVIWNIWQCNMFCFKNIYFSTRYHHVQLNLIALLRECWSCNLVILNVNGAEVSVCTQQLARSVRFQAPQLLYTPLLHRYFICSYITYQHTI